MKKTLFVILTLVLTVAAFGVVTYDLQKVIIVPEKPQGDLEVSIWLDRDNGSLYYSGEEVKTYFKVNKDAYVAIYDITPNGEIQLIFPNGYDRDNFVKANVTYSLPTDKATTRYRLQLTSETGGGKEIFQIVASTKPLGFLDDLMRKVQSGQIFPRADTGAENFVTAKVIPVIDKQEYAVSTAWLYLDVMPSTGRARITTSPSGATIYIDGKMMGTSPITLDLDVGNHMVTAYKDSYRTETRQFSVDSGRTTEVSINLQKFTREYQLSLLTNPSGADIYIDNRYLGRSPLNVTLEEGSKNLRIEKSGYETYTETFMLNRSISRSISLTPQVVNYRLSINSSPSNARVYINGNYEGRTPLTTTLREGQYNVQLTSDGYEDFTTTVNLDRDRQINATLYGRKARLSVETEPSNASVFIDNSYVGRSPVSVDLEGGRHTVRVEKSGYLTESRDVNLSSGTSSTLRIPMQEEKPIARINISSDPSNARIFINGKDYGRSGKTVELEPGYYEIVLILDGYRVSLTYRYFGKGDHSLPFNLSRID